MSRRLVHLTKSCKSIEKWEIIAPACAPLCPPVPIRLRLIQENVDPSVRADLEAFARRLVPPADDPAMGWVTHRSEGPDDMPAHLKAALLPTSLTVPVVGGRPALGTWQGIYLWEHRTRPHRREVVAHLA